ncbi:MULTISPECIES: hypothetical protein [Halorhodospira]|uniref:hypothetical protein n=1 Tax=Halorhodospira TaxID=85108 RepID=UPI001EE84E13|nr:MULTISPECIES: hypothetical protein [Halorhodospira]MCG5528053.1 hypothetical protein [Halorhodospira halophila]MCG5543075.1 hypothetical protein [Halorhodospira sp. 9628]
MRIDVALKLEAEDDTALPQVVRLMAGRGGYRDRQRKARAQTIQTGFQRIEDIARGYQKARAAVLGEQRPP